MVVISDTTTITNLMHIGHLNLLEKLFGKILIPSEVYKELITLPNQKIQIDQKGWIEIVSIADKKIFNELVEYLDRGEAEAIVLALEKSADLLIIDELAGRKIAKEKKIRIIGLLGILIESKNSGLIENLKELLDELIAEFGFRVNPKLYQQVLKSVGEE